VRVACVSYSPDSDTYLGWLDTRQDPPNFKNKETAMRYAEKQIRYLGRRGIKARVWATRPEHENSGHIHIVALIHRRDLKRLYPSSYHLAYVGQF
jgi:hypothetical protein